jgi:hypothetical protein
LLLILALLTRARALSISTSGKWIALGYLVLYALLPRRLFDSAFIDVRMITALALILPGFLLFSAKRWVGVASVVAASGIILAQTANVASVWLSYGPEYEALKSSFAHISRGSAVLVGYSGDRLGPDSSEQPIFYAPTLAAHYAKAFLPSLYTSPGTMPIVKAPSVRHLEVMDTLDYLPPPLKVLKTVAVGNGAADAPSYVANWPLDYDYLYIVGPAVPNPLPHLLHELAAGERFTLYRIRR